MDSWDLIKASNLTSQRLLLKCNGWRKGKKKKAKKRFPAIAKLCISRLCSSEFLSLLLWRFFSIFVSCGDDLNFHTWHVTLCFMGRKMVGSYHVTTSQGQLPSWRFFPLVLVLPVCRPRSLVWDRYTRRSFHPPVFTSSALCSIGRRFHRFHSRCEKHILSSQFVVIDTVAYLPTHLLYIPSVRNKTTNTCKRWYTHKGWHRLLIMPTAARLCSNGGFKRSIYIDIKMTSAHRRTRTCSAAALCLQSS